MPVEALLEAHSAARDRISSRVVELLTRSWASLGSWNRADVETFLSRALPAVSAGQALTAQLVDVYAAQVLTDLLGERVGPVGISPADVTALRPVPPETVYERPFVQLWSELKAGQRFNDALTHAQARLVEITEDDLTLSYRRAALIVANRQPRITGYRRVIRPELARKDGTCGLCIAASGQVYRKSTLMPIHTHCHCAVMPIVGAKDPGRDINGQDIDSLYRQAAANGRSREELSAARFTVHEHGELGPYLTPKGQHFTGPSSIPAAPIAA